jgi:hypothetical protein
LLKNENCQNGVFTIPLWRGRRDTTLVKTAQNSDVGHGYTHRRGGYPRAPTRATRLLRPNGLTRPEYQLTQPTWLTCMMMTSAWCNYGVIMHCGMPCQRPVSWHVSTMGPTNHVISREPAGLSRVEFELSREPRDRIECRWSYVQPVLKLNLGYSSSQNCFEQILAIWNAIWMILDLFPANWSFWMQWYDLIVEIETESGGGELLREIARWGGIWRTSWWSMEMLKKKSHTFA